jgi:hypothetical protein
LPYLIERFSIVDTIGATAADSRAATGLYGHRLWFVTRNNQGAAMQSRIDALKRQADLLLKQGRQNEAASCYRTILFLGLWRRGVLVKDRFDAYIGLSRIYYSRWKYWRAAFVCRRALALAKRKIGPVSAEVVTALDMLAYIYTGLADQEAVATTNMSHVHTGRHARILWQAAFDRSPHRAQALGYIARKQQIEMQLQELNPP